MDKRSLLEERKKKWMSDRQVSMVRERAVKETSQEMRFDASASGEHRPRASGSSNDRAVDGNTQAQSDVFLNKLTDKLAAHIREEVKKEMRTSLHTSDLREAVAEKMESYLEAELGTHTCKICFELMASPQHTPILLFPCGHTFCRVCVETQATKAKPSGSSSYSGGRGGGGAATMSGFNCPYCRSLVQSSAVNQALKELIDQFVTQKEAVSRGDSLLLDDVFLPTGNAATNLSASNSSSADFRRSGGGGGGGTGGASQYDSQRSETEDGRREKSRYVGQLKSCQMRHTILKNELDDEKNELANLHKKMRTMAAASDHLRKERAAVDAKIRLLEEERLLIDAHLTEQSSKQSELENREGGIKGRVNLLESTLTGLSSEIDKLSLLVEGVSSDNHHYGSSRTRGNDSLY